MSVKAKLEDFVVLVKNDRKWQAGTALVVVFIFCMFIMDDGGKRRRRGAGMGDQASNVGMGKQEAYDDLISAFQASLTEVTHATKENQKRSEEIQENLSNMEERTSQIFKKILERMESEADARVAKQVPDAVEVTTGSITEIPEPQQEPQEQIPETTNPDTLVTWDLSSAPIVAPPPQNKIEKVAYVGAGDSVRVKLLSGVNAPTDGTPYPVIFKLTGDVDGPDGSALPLGEARLIAAAQGSLTDSRALFRLHTINIRLPNGRREVLDVDGWIVGEDGLRGMPGIMIDPLGKGIAAETANGFVKGIGQALSANQINSSLDRNGNIFTNITGDAFAFAFGKGVSRGADKWSDVIKERVDELVPHVQVYSGREATAVFAESVKIKGLYEALEDEQDVFASLD